MLDEVNWNRIGYTVGFAGVCIVSLNCLFAQRSQRTTPPTRARAQITGIKKIGQKKGGRAFQPHPVYYLSLAKNSNSAFSYTAISTFNAVGSPFFRLTNKDFLKFSRANATLS